MAMRRFEDLARGNLLVSAVVLRTLASILKISHCIASHHFVYQH